MTVVVAPLMEIGAAVVDGACVELSTVTRVCVRFGTVDVVTAAVINGVVVLVLTAGVGAELVALGFKALIATGVAGKDWVVFNVAVVV